MLVSYVTSYSYKIHKCMHMNIVSSVTTHVIWLIIGNDSKMSPNAISSEYLISNFPRGGMPPDPLCISMLYKLIMLHTMT